MRNLPKIPLIIITINLALLLNAQGVFAAFSLSVTPFEGGQDIRFGQVAVQSQPFVNKEVTIRTTSDINKQYRIIQRVLEPLHTATGVEVPYNSLRVYGIRGTNAYGTLSVTREVPVTLPRTILYTSNTQGSSDSFQLVYQLVTSNIPAGSYRGRISYTLEPIDSTQSSQTVVLNMFAEVSVESAIKIQAQDNSKVISLKQKGEQKHSFEVGFEIIGGLGQQFKITQLISEPLISVEGRELTLDNINFNVKGNKRGVATTEPKALDKKEQIIYTSSLDGKPDSFIVTYNLEDITDQRPGRYKSRIRYILQAPGAIKSGLLDTFSLEVENEKIFEINITSETGGINFVDLRPQDPPKISEVLIEVSTNTGKAYQVTQNVISELANKAGDIIPQEYFSLRTESVDTKGDLKFPQNTEVRRGDTVIFISDKQGSSTKFNVIYELTIPPDIKKGDYATRIIYSLSEM